MERLWLTLAMVALCALTAAALWWGWRRRAARQSYLPELPATPIDLGVDACEPVVGMYVSTTTSGHWQDYIAVRDLGRTAAATVHLHPGGVLIDRVGEDEIFIPTGNLESVGTAKGISGKVVGTPDGILRITWRLGGYALDTGIKADDRQIQQEWIDSAARQIAATPGRGTA